MFRLVKIGGPASFFVKEDELMSPCGKCDILEAGMNFYTREFGIGEVCELGGFESANLLEKHR
jgi:hypothetical protein